MEAQFSHKSRLENLQRLDDKKIGWGFNFGFNKFSFDLENNPNIAEVTNDISGGGISIALMGFYKINDLLDVTVEPGMNLTERAFLKEDGEKILVSATYIDIPVFIKLNGKRWGNTRPYLKTGLGFTLNLESEENNSNIDLNTIVLTKNNFNAQAEMGIEIYFKRFKLTPFVKGIFFLNDELVKQSGSPDWIQSIDGLQSRGAVFALRFQ